MPEIIRSKTLPALLVIMVLLGSCGPAVVLEGFDETSWKNDPNGCKGARSEMMAVFQTQKDKLKGLYEPDLKKVLGKPDKTELYIRSQKFFIYYLQPSPECSNGTEQPLTLKVRFNALGYTNEIFLENLSQ